MKPKIEDAVDHIINGLTIDGAHHKQWDMEQALIALKGKAWVEKNRWVNEDGEKASSKDKEVFPRWEEGIPG